MSPTTSSMDWMSCYFPGQGGHVAKSLSRHWSVWLAMFGLMAVCQLPTGESAILIFVSRDREMRGDKPFSNDLKE